MAIELLPCAVATKPTATELLPVAKVFAPYAVAFAPVAVAPVPHAVVVPATVHCASAGLQKGSNRPEHTTALKTNAPNQRFRSGRDCSLGRMECCPVWKYAACYRREPLA